MKKFNSKKLLLHTVIILGVLFLNITAFSVKPSSNKNNNPCEKTKSHVPSSTQKTSKSPSSQYKTNSNIFKKNPVHSSLPYLKDITIYEQYQKSKAPQVKENINTSDHLETKNSVPPQNLEDVYEEYYDKTNNIKITQILTKNGVSIVRKTQINACNDEYSDNLDNHEYVDDNPNLIKVNNLYDYFKTKIINNLNAKNMPNKFKYIALTLTIDDRFNFNKIKPDYTTKVLSTNCLINYLDQFKINIDEKLYGYENLTMIVIDDRIKFDKPLNFSKNIWVKKHKNLNFIIFVKRAFIQNLTLQEWSDLTFYIPFAIEYNI